MKIQFINRTMPGKSLNGPLLAQLGFLIVALCSFAFLSAARAQLNPPPDGGYPNFNTAEGENVLYSLTTGGLNTAIGFDTLQFNTTGRYNTATGAAPLANNTANYNTADGFDALLPIPAGARIRPPV